MASDRRPTPKQAQVMVGLMKLGSATARELADELDEPEFQGEIHPVEQTRHRLELCRKRGWVGRDRFRRPKGGWGPWRYRLTSHGRDALDG